MTVAYRGERFHGWQVQPSGISVQQRLEEALGTITRLGPTVAVTGAGRTDAGVNASAMVAHVDLPDDIATEPLRRALNALCGPDIHIYSFRRVRADAHARFDATSRTYHYYLSTSGRDPFWREMAWPAPAGTDFNAMNEAARLLLSTSDFTSFAKLHTDTKTNICHVSRARWVTVEDRTSAFLPPLSNIWRFEITADRFLRNMVRAVVGTLIEVGRGKMSVDDFQAVIDRRDRGCAGTSMPPGPLFLASVTYPSDVYL